MNRHPHSRTLHTIQNDHFTSPWLERETGLALAFKMWKQNIPECFTANRWHKQIADSEHFRTAMLAASPPPSKLLYDSYVWSRVLASYLGWGASCDILELLPGRSLTVPVALQALGFCGRLHRADCAALGSLPPTFEFATIWEPGDVLELESTPAKVILGNHVLDDMIASLHYGPTTFYTEMYGNPAAEREAWVAIANSRSLSDSIAEVVRFFRRLLMQPGVGLLILREYPATVAILHTNVEHVMVHSACYSAVIAACSSLEHVSVGHPDSVGDYVPAGSRHPRSFLAVSKNSEKQSPRHRKPFIC